MSAAADEQPGVGGWLRRHRGLMVFAAFALIFAAFFWHIRGGVGQYWDWSFPYFSDQTHNIFTNKDSSWTGANGGSPLNYASDYFFRFFIGMFGFLRPETLHYLLLVGMFAAGACGMYMLTRRYTSRWLAFLLALLAWINPAVFYKYTAGHFNYFFSLALFIYFVHFLLHHFRKDFRSHVVVGLFFAFLGVQIQFFIIGGIFLLAFMALNREKVAWKYLPIVIGLPLLINLVWLANFITGAASTAETGAAAAKVSFKGSSASSFLNIFTFSFSKATLLSRFYAFYELLWNASLFVFLLWLLARGSSKRKEKADVLLLVFLAVIIFLATGMYQVLNLYPLTILYPMLREVGHFAPVIVLAALLLIARLVEQTRWRWALLVVILGSLLIVGVKFEFFSQRIDFAAERQQFAPFKQIADQGAGNYRILAYPFFDKYVLKNAPADPPTEPPLRNSGHDSFAAFASQDFLQNAVAPYQFQTSVQYQLLQTYNIDVLRPWGVKYIFDFSGIYESDYNWFVPAATYNNDLSLIKNDPHFLDKLLAHNPGRLKRINAHVLEVTDPLPRMAASTQLFSLASDEQANDASMFTRQQLHQALDFTSDPSLATYTTRLTQLFASPDTSSFDKAGGTFSQALHTSSPATLYTNQLYRDLTYQATATTLTIYAQTAPPLVLNGQALSASSTVKQVVATLPLADTPYYVSFGGVITPVRPNHGGDLGSGKAGEKLEILRGDGSNVISNSSFEQNLWEPRVGDCNNYDGNGALAMKRDTATASDGHASLLLSATRHDACTSTPLRLSANTQYLLSFDYQSDNANTANFFLEQKGQAAPLAKGSRAITDHNWHTATMLVNSGAQPTTARLFLYALEGDGRTATINRYDAVTMIKLSPLQTATIPSGGSAYAMFKLSPGGQTFTFRDASYQYANLIANPSFEKGSWQPMVGDCNAYDGLAKLSMQLDKNDKTAGQQSLLLSATRHDACVHTTANVTQDADYLLTFDYKTTGTKTYGYATSFDDPGATLSRNQLTSAGPGWHTARVVVHVPAATSTLTLYLYAFEGNGRSASTVHYDNVNLTQLPDFADRFFVVQQPAVRLTAPQTTAMALPSQSARTLRIASARTPFFVLLSESYHPRWRLELDNGAVDGPLDSWLPNAAATTAGLQHVQLDGAINGWLVDPSKLCRAGQRLRPGCLQNADGSYAIKLKAEFVPQRWFAIAAAISWLSALGALAYVVLVRPDAAPRYRRRA